MPKDFLVRNSEGEGSLKRAMGGKVDKIKVVFEKYRMKSG
jgi:hypothetical protein